VRGRWIWRLIGLAVIAVLALLILRTIIKPLNVSAPEMAHPMPVRTFTVSQPVSGLNVTSYGAPITVVQGPGANVTVAEEVSFFGKEAPPAVSATVSRGVLTLAAPACADAGCSVGFTVTVPRYVTVSAHSGGGSISVSGATEATLDSGGGPVTVHDVQQSLSVTSEGGGITVNGAGSAYLDSGDAPISATAVKGTLNVTSEGGGVDVHGAGSTTVDSGGGPVAVSSVTGTLTVTADGGGIYVNGAPDASLNSGGGPIAAHAISGALTADSSGASIALSGVAGSLTADTGGAPIDADGLAGTIAKVNTDGGSAWLSFAVAPLNVQLITGDGDGVLLLPGGPYAVNADSSGGPQSVTVPVSPASPRLITVSTDGGGLQVRPAGS
jgi:hypothetical protein